MHGVIITSGMQDEELSALRSEWPEIEVHTDLSMGDCLDCLRNCLFNAVLLRDDNRGAGHITMVASMLLGKAQIVTRAQVVQDYVAEDRHALMVEVGSSSGFTQAAARLRDDGPLRERLGDAARAFALRHLSHRSVSDRLRAVVDELFPGRPPEAPRPAPSSEAGGAS